MLKGIIVNMASCLERFVTRLRVPSHSLPDFICLLQRIYILMISVFMNGGVCDQRISVMSG